MNILKNANVLTMAHGDRLLRADVAIENGIIRAVSQTPIKPQPGDVVEDFMGCTIMPGLFDSHVHYDESYMADFFLAAGVTSVRNMSGSALHAVWRDETLAGKRIGPYIFSSGPIVDGEDPTIPENDNIILRIEADADRVIEFTCDCGFLWMKTYPSIDPQLYRYLMARCREEGLPVCGHMTKRMSHIELVRSGYVCCEHTSSLPSDPEEIRELARMGMWLCPTHVVCETMPDYVWGGKKLSDLEHYADLPEYVRNRWEEKNAVIIEAYHKNNVHPDFNVIIQRGRTFVESAPAEHILAGSDCAYPGMIPGFALHDELERLVRVYGLTEYQAIAAATINPAKHIGIADKKGCIVPGADADLLVLRGNPLEDIDAVKKTVKLYQGERHWTAEELTRKLRADAAFTPEDVEIIVRKGGSPEDAL